MSCALALVSFLSRFTVVDTTGRLSSRNFEVTGAAKFSARYSNIRRRGGPATPHQHTMALAYRAPRTSSFDVSSKGKSPAPGTYNIAQDYRPQSVPYVGFNTTGQRSSLTVGNSSTTPGPGEHQAMSTNGTKNMREFDAGSNSFKSNSSRFAPFAPGSTVFRPSSILENPGPASYDVRKPIPGTKKLKQQPHPSDAATNALNLGIPESEAAHQQRMRKQRRQRAQSSGMPDMQEIMQSMTSRHTPVPTIPIRRQSHGYDQEMVTGKLIPQPAPTKDYSGIGSDTIGPAAYDVRQDPTKAGGPRVNFAKSSKRKTLFGGPEATRLVGPGSHNLAGARFVDRTTQGTAAFNSGVPMAHQREDFNGSGVDNVGPGAYNLPSSIKTVNESSSNIAEGLISSVQRFGSTESRNGGWSRDLHAPYTNKKSNQGPGPGAYGEKRTSFRTKIQKKLTDEVIGFGATDTR